MPNECKFKAETTDAGRDSVDWHETIWQHNSTGTYELLPPPTAAASVVTTAGFPEGLTTVLESTDATPEIAGDNGMLWGLLLLAAVPHLALSTVLFAVKKVRPLAPTSAWQRGW